jgi:hypothetical protein
VRWCAHNLAHFNIASIKTRVVCTCENKIKALLLRSRGWRVAQLLHALGQRCLICECLGLRGSAKPIRLAAGGAELADLAGQIRV